EHREVCIDEARLLHHVARRVPVAATCRPREGGGIEEAGLWIAAAGHRVPVEDGSHEVQARVVTGQAGASGALAAGEVEVVARGERDVGPVTGDEVVLT